MGQYYMFNDLKSARDITKYTLFRGTTDWTQLEQFDMYESGYNYLVMISMPKFIRDMAEQDPEVDKLAKAYKHIIERDFLGFDTGLDNITVETQEISNNVQSVNVITKVNAPSATTFSMTLRERSGTPITRMHELYLRCLKDPGTEFKTYNGLIQLPGITTDKEGYYIDPKDAGFHKECFSFLYLATDNTGLLLERAVYYVCCQPQSANLEIYNGQHGTPEFQQVSCEFSGLPLMSDRINEQAKRILNWMNNKANENMVQRNSWNFDYEQVAGRRIDGNRMDDSAARDHGLLQSSLIGNQ